MVGKIALAHPVPAEPKPTISRSTTRSTPRTDPLVLEARPIAPYVNGQQAHHLEGEALRQAIIADKAITSSANHLGEYGISEQRKPE